MTHAQAGELPHLGAPPGTARSLLKPTNWPLGAKLGALVVATALLPLALAGWLDIREKEKTLTEGLEQLLSARAEQVAREFDSRHLGYQGTAVRVANLPLTRETCAADDAPAALRQQMAAALETLPASDRDIRGAALLDRNGRVTVTNAPGLAESDAFARTSYRKALDGQSLINGIYISSAASGNLPTVGYLVPVPDGNGRPRCVIALWVHANAFLWRLPEENHLAGPGSYMVVFDQYSVRIANSLNNTVLYRPAAPLPAQVVEGLVQEERYGPDTRALLAELLPFPEQAQRVFAERPDRSMFQGFAPVNGTANYGVVRRLQNAHWTVFYMSPVENLTSQIAAATHERLLLMLLLVVVSLAAALVFAAHIVRPLRELARASASLTEGGTHTPVVVRGNDEVARLAARFNAMALRLRAQSTALQESNDRLERNVRERTGLLHAIVDNAMAVIYVKDVEGRFLLVNDRFCELFGLAREQVLNRTGHEIFDQATADTFRAMDVRVATGGATLVEEERVRHGGLMHTYLSVKCPLRDETGRVYGIAAVSTDITERKQAETRQLAQLERLRLLDQISTAIGARQDLQSIYAEVIHSVEQHLPVDLCVICRYEAAAGVLIVDSAGPQGGALGAQAGAPLLSTIPVGTNGLRRCVAGELVHEPDLARSPHPLSLRLVAAGLRTAVMAPLQVENQVFGVLIATRREPGSFSSTDCEFLRQLSNHVALAAQQAQLTDALRAAYEDLRQSQQAMLQQERLSALGQMASGIAHDINNAISPAALYAESLLEQDAATGGRARHELQIIARAIDDVAATVARMREFYRHREAPAEHAPVNLNMLMQQVADLTRARWSDMPGQRGMVIDLRLEPAAGLPPVSGSEHELREALINLVFNAVDAMPSGGRIVMRTRTAADGRVCFEVQDDGVGMDEETRRRCLEPFFTTKGERGTGMGLAMVYGVAQRHEAAIEIDTEPGRGTCVRLTFAPAEGDVDTRAPTGTQPLPGRLLVIDDDPLLLASLRDGLAADGHTVVTAQGGMAGAAAFGVALDSGKPFDAVITDLGMPGMDGRQVARTVKAMAPSTPVILLTGWGQPLGDTAAPMADIDHMLSKPPRLRQLRALLNELLPGFSA